MKVNTLFYHQNQGWADSFADDWDSPNTLVIVFGAASFLENAKPLQELAARFPQSKLIGCSTAGEILGRTVNDESLVGAVIRFDKTHLQEEFTPISSAADSFEAGEKIALRLNKPGLKGGWDIFGPKRRVTKSDGNHLFELDGKPALRLYKNYPGERAAELPASALLFPLSLRTTANDEKRIVRTILSVDEINQSMTFPVTYRKAAWFNLCRRTSTV